MKAETLLLPFPAKPQLPSTIFGSNASLIILLNDFWLVSKVSLVM